MASATALESRTQPRGMLNYGATCYLNAAMQALAACPALVRHVHESTPILQLPTERPKTELAIAFSRILEGLSQGGTTSSSAFQPSDLVQSCQGLTLALQGGGQQDAQEFLGALLDALHEHYQRPLTEPELIDLRARVSSRWRECTNEEWKDEAQLAYEAQLKAQKEQLKEGDIAPAIPPPPRPQTSLFSQLFQGQLLSCVTCCGCGAKSFTADPMFSLSVPLPTSKHSTPPDGSAPPSDRDVMTNDEMEEEEEASAPASAPNGNMPGSPPARGRSLTSWISGTWRMTTSAFRVTGGGAGGGGGGSGGDRGLSLQDSLAEFFRSEDLAGNDCYRCDKCKALQRAKKELRLLSLPPLLAIHVKRFSFVVGAKKAGERIGFPLSGLSLAPFTAAAAVSTPTRQKGTSSNNNRVAGEPPSRMPTSLYDLYAVVVHHGSSISHGHYTAYVRRGDGAWFHIDDTRVTQTTEEEVSAAEAYLLFYERRQSVHHQQQREAMMAMLSAAAAPGRKSEPEPSLLCRGWWASYLATDEPGPVTHSDVLCPHNCVDMQRNATMVAARACFLAVPPSVFKQLVNAHHQTAEAAPLITELKECRECARLHQAEKLALEQERDRIKALDSTDIKNNMWFIVDASWLKHWREYCWEMIRSDPPGPVCNWRLLVGGRPRQNLVRATDYRGVNLDVWRVFVSRYGGGPAIIRAELDIYAPPYAPSQAPEPHHARTKA